MSSLLLDSKYNNHYEYFKKYKNIWQCLNFSCLHPCWTCKDSGADGSYYLVLIGLVSNPSIYYLCFSARTSSTRASTIRASIICTSGPLLAPPPFAPPLFEPSVLVPPLSTHPSALRTRTPQSNAQRFLCFSNVVYLSVNDQII